MKQGKLLMAILVIFILCTTISIPANVVSATSSGNNQKVISSGSYDKGYRYNIQGWVYIHIEGEPYERGYQYGYLASAEIVDAIQRWNKIGHGTNFMKLFATKNLPKDYDEMLEQWWEICRSKAMNIFLKQIPEEYKQELKGIADGIKAQGGTIFGRDIDYEDIVASQFVQEILYNFKYFKKRFHPLRGLFYGAKDILAGGKDYEARHCNAFIATGDATVNGGIVVAHTTIFQKLMAERCNIILDVQPSDGYRFIMTCPPGSIWSQEDWYQNDQGIVLTETELPQGPWNKRGTPKGVRSRKAIQYSDSIDEAIGNLMDGNNGLIPNEWLIGDVKTGEIASLEQALFNTPVKRTFDGFYWSCNIPHDLKVQRELYGLKSISLRIGSKFLPALFEYDVAEKFKEIEKECYGEIDVDLAKKIMSTYPMTRMVTDCKITDSKLMENMGLIAFIGIPNGSQWDPSDDFKNNYHGATEFPACGWLKIYPSNSNSVDLQHADIVDYKKEASRVLWQYETEFIRNIDYSSSVISEDTAYAASSVGTAYALDIGKGKVIWERKIAEEAIAPEISNGLVFIGTDQGVFSLDKETGNIKWKRLVGDISSKPIATNDLVIVSCSDGNIYAFDVDSGKVAWKYAFLESTYVSEGKDENIYVCSGDICYAFDIINNEILWEYKADGLITASPRISEKTVYFGSWDGNIYAVDSVSGNLKWSCETGWGIDSTPAISDGTLFLGGLDNNFYALEEETGELKWVFTCNSAIHSSPATYGEYVFFGCDDGRFYALNKTDGSLAWSFTPGYSIDNDNANNYITTPILSNPVVENGVVYFGAKGVIYALDAQTQEKQVEKITNEIMIDGYLVLLLIALLFLILGVVLVYKMKKR